MADKEIKETTVEELKTEPEPESKPVTEPKVSAKEVKEVAELPIPGADKIPLVQKEQPIAVEKGEATEEQIKEVKAGKYYTIKELANELRYSTTWIYSLVTSGRIKAVKPTGGTWRIPPSEVERIKTEGMPPMPREKPAVEASEIVIDDKHIERVAPVPKEEKPGKVDIIKYLFGKE